MASNGVKVKPLETFPELIEIDIFFLEMFNLCGNNFNNIIEYCSLFEFSKEEILEAIKIIALIEKEVKNNAGNTIRT